MLQRFGRDFEHAVSNPYSYDLSPADTNSPAILDDSRTNALSAEKKIATVPHLEDPAFGGCFAGHGDSLRLPGRFARDRSQVV